MMKGSEAQRVFTDNLKAILKDRGMSQSKLAEAIGSSRQAVHSWVDGISYPRASALDKIARALDVSHDDLIGSGSGYLNRIDMVSVPSVPVPVRRLGAVHAGEPEGEDGADDQALMPSHVVERHPRGFALLVVGDCMDRVIPEGSTVLVDPDEEARDGSVVVARLVDAGECVMRRLRRGRTSAILVADSFAPHDDLTFRDGETVEVVGVVVWMQMDLEEGEVAAR